MHLPWQLYKKKRSYKSSRGKKKSFHRHSRRGEKTKIIFYGWFFSSSNDILPEAILQSLASRVVSGSNVCPAGVLSTVFLSIFRFEFAQKFFSNLQFARKNWRIKRRKNREYFQNNSVNYSDLSWFGEKRFEYFTGYFILAVPSRGIIFKKFFNFFDSKMFNLTPGSFSVVRMWP